MIVSACVFIRIGPIRTEGEIYYSEEEMQSATFNVQFFFNFFFIIIVFSLLTSVLC